MLRWAIGMLSRAEAVISGRAGYPATPSLGDMPPSECFVSESESPLVKSDELRGQRTEVAMSLTDEDTYGYITLVLKRPKYGGANGHIQVAGYVQQEWWPAFAEVCDRIEVLASESVG